MLLVRKKFVSLLQSFETSVMSPPENLYNEIDYLYSHESIYVFLNFVKSDNEGSLKVLHLQTYVVKISEQRSVLPMILKL